jgi:hypothetical protein
MVKVTFESYPSLSARFTREAVDDPGPESPQMHETLSSDDRIAAR